MEHPIILFDGNCLFCDRSVQFVIEYDKDEVFYFATLQGEVGKQLLQRYAVPQEMDSLILIKNGQVFMKSSAALHICFGLKGGWKLLSCLSWIPYPIRDFFYDWIARNRYKWFGKKESCRIPTKSVRDRFLD